MESPTEKLSISALLDRRVIIMLFLGFSAGLPILLIFSSLSVWLREAGVARSTVTYFSWAALGYSFKFVWAPLVDQLRLPVLGSLLGRRRSWLLLAQCMVMMAIWLMSGIDPASGDNSLTLLALAAVLLGFSSATQDIVIDAFRIESAEPRMQALLASTYITGYRLAMILAGAGALFLAEHLGSLQQSYSFDAWSQTYKIMSMAMLIGIVTTLVISEPERTGRFESSVRENLKLVVMFVVCVLVFIGCYIVTSEPADAIRISLSELLANKQFAGVLVEMTRLGVAVATAWTAARGLIATRLVEKRTMRKSYLEPVQDFFQRYGASTAWLFLGLIGLYRMSDIVLGTISNVFYYDLLFSKSQVGLISKTFGLVMIIVGGLVGGILAFRFGVMRILLLGAILSAGTNLLFLLLAETGNSVPLLVVVIIADNLAAGIAGTAFVAFLSALTNINFTAMQYAIFSSLMTLLPKTLGGYSGSMVDSIGYSQFFIVTTALGLPVIILILMASSRLDIDSRARENGGVSL
ncbi:MAG: AmpG family muropeptide MFS transporter [bacterium]